jgi:hypothetical protein
VLRLESEVFDMSAIDKIDVRKYADDKKAYFEDLILLAGDDDFETITRLEMEQIDGIVERYEKCGMTKKDAIYFIDHV